MGWRALRRFFDTFQKVFRASYERHNTNGSRHLTDWHTLSILQTSKLIHLEASSILYAHSRFHITNYEDSQSLYLRVNEKRMGNVTIYIDYTEVSQLEAELPRLDLDESDLPGRELAFHNFAKACRVQTTLKSFEVCVIMPNETVQSAEGAEATHLEKLGQRLARFLGVQQISVNLIHPLSRTSWTHGAEPKILATPLLKHLRPWFGSYKEENAFNMDVEYLLQRFMFRDPVS